MAAARPLCGDQPMMILSGDPPKSRVLTLVLVLIILALVATPFLFPGAKALNVAAKICVFAALVASYDLLLGYTGSVSFAHTMFYGIGSYAIAIALYGMGPNWGAVATGIVVGLPLAALLALAIGLFSLRVAAIFFAMITLAVASAFQVLASQLSWLTGGEDGRSFQLPELLRPGTVLISKNLMGFEVNGRILTYYLVFAVSALMILALLRVVNSPFGRVLQAIRENRFRAEALGFRTVFHLSYANCIAALVAAGAGILNALWLRYAGPDTSLSFSIMLDILLMVVIGGMGTIYGAIIGATIFILAQNYLQALMGVAAKAASEAGLPLLPGLLHPDRWLLWLGLLFIASVYFFPTGVVGRLRNPGDKSAGGSH
ncbi:branched-chain amino acid ABC transporter permease [Bradyrhizobium sp. MOS002]|nr:branched-chain amino acid ABC transporter permease [Bradyrhizobium sp. MOS002]